MTEEEWAELDRKIASWEKWRLEKTAKEARAASQKVLDDARIDPEDLRKPTTI